MNQTLCKSIFDKIRENPGVTILPPTFVEAPILKNGAKFSERLGELCFMVGREIGKDFNDWIATEVMANLDGVDYCIAYFRKYAKLPWDGEEFPLSDADDEENSV